MAVVVTMAVVMAVTMEHVAGGGNGAMAAVTVMQLSFALQKRLVVLIGLNMMQEPTTLVSEDTSYAYI